MIGRQGGDRGDHRSLPRLRSPDAGTSALERGGAGNTLLLRRLSLPGCRRCRPPSRSGDRGAADGARPRCDCLSFGGGKTGRPGRRVAQPHGTGSPRCTPHGPRRPARNPAARKGGRSGVLSRPGTAPLASLRKSSLPDAEHETLLQRLGGIRRHGGIVDGGPVAAQQVPVDQPRAHPVEFAG